MPDENPPSISYETPNQYRPPDEVAPVTPLPSIVIAVVSLLVMVKISVIQPYLTALFLLLDSSKKPDVFEAQLTAELVVIGIGFVFFIVFVVCAYRILKWAGIRFDYEEKQRRNRGTALPIPSERTYELNQIESATALPGVPQPTELVYEKTGDRLRIRIPFRWQEKLLAAAVLSVVLLFAGAMAGSASIASANVLGARVALAIDVIFGGIIVLLAIAVVLALWLARGNIFEFDGNSLRLLSFAGKVVKEWPCAKIHDISLVRLPVLPLGQISLQVGFDKVRFGIYHPGPLAAAVALLREAMELDSTAGK